MHETRFGVITVACATKQKLSGSFEAIFPPMFESSEISRGMILLQTDTYAETLDSRPFRFRSFLNVRGNAFFLMLLLR